MRNSITINDPESINNQKINTLGNLGSISLDLIKSNPVLKFLATEDAEHFARYIEMLHLEPNSRLLLLSSLHHYYYDAEEMINVETVVNLKELNHTKQLKNFLHSMYHILPPKCKLVGCFVNNRKQTGFVLNTNPEDSYYKRNLYAIENGIASSSPFLNMIYNMIDSKTNKYMSERSVSVLLGEHGFKVLDMTEIDELTYFCAQSLRTREN